MGWINLLTEQAEKFIENHGIGNFFSAQELSALIGTAFTGAESAIILGLEEKGVPYRQALRRFGDLLSLIETQTSIGG
jgi:hypothetical protein